MVVLRDASCRSAVGLVGLDVVTNSQTGVRAPAADFIGTELRPYVVKCSDFKATAHLVFAFTFNS